MVRIADRLPPDRTTPREEERDEVAIRPGLPIATSLDVALRALLHDLETADLAVRASDDAEALHDLRVAIRRTRSLLGQLRTAFDPAVAERFRSGFAWLGRLTGPMRDVDVMLLALRKQRGRMAPGTRGGIDALRATFEERRRRERDRLLRAMDARAYRAVLGGWREALLAGDPVPWRDAAVQRATGDVLARRITRLHRRIVRTAREIDHDTPIERLHEVRIDCKKLRYLLETFEPCLRPSRAARVVRQLRKLQNALGAVHDAETQIHTVLAATPADAPRAAEISRSAGALAQVLWQEQQRSTALAVERMGRFTRKRMRRQMRRLVA